MTSKTAAAQVALAEQALRLAQAEAFEAQRRYAMVVAAAQTDLAKALRGLQESQ